VDTESRRISQAEALALWTRYEPAKSATLEQFLWTRIHGAVPESRVSQIHSAVRKKLRERMHGHEDAVLLMDA
jgi:hypothetical protein